MKPALKLCPWLFSALDLLEHAAAADRLGHGWIFSGPRGIGKFNLACVLAERILHERMGSTLPERASPQDVLADPTRAANLTELHSDLHGVAPEEGKQSIQVDQVRAIIADLALTPLKGNNKVVIFERADKMTNGAANALLKSLEEPAGDTYLLLLAERPGRLPATVRSRCQQLPLRLPPLEATRHWLERADLPVEHLPAGLSRMPPIRLASLLSEDDNINKYNKIFDDLQAISRNSGDPLAIADRWQKQDPELALGCLIDSLRLTIRAALLPGHTNRITEESELIMDNYLRNGAIGSLFARLRMAENLREQIGRGTNIELALKALLLGLDIADDKRLEV
jgi:DNA polymerase-3 subunit delta'